MTKTKADRQDAPVQETLDSEVISFRAQFDQRSPLDEIVLEGARRMLQTAIDAEVNDFIAMHADRTDDHGRRLVVKNGNAKIRAKIRKIRGQARFHLQSIISGPNMACPHFLSPFPQFS